jgi:hypothetical protein
MNGINIQYPWSEMLINEEKCVETRSYPLPQKYEGEELALIETPGRNGNFKSRIIGIITFSHSFKYPNKTTWLDDYNRHLVPEDSIFGWDDKKDKYGWVVSKVVKFNDYRVAPKNRGIIFSSNCELFVGSGAA